MVNGDDSGAGMDRFEKEDLVYDRWDTMYGDDYKWEVSGKYSFQTNLESMPDDALDFMLNVTPAEAEEYANYGFDEGMEDPPQWLEDLGWRDDDGDWHNPFWYH